VSKKTVLICVHSCSFVVRFFRASSWPDKNPLSKLVLNAAIEPCHKMAGLTVHHDFVSVRV